MPKKHPQRYNAAFQRHAATIDPLLRSRGSLYLSSFLGTPQAIPVPQRDCMKWGDSLFENNSPFFRVDSPKNASVLRVLLFHEIFGGRVALENAT